MRTNIEFRNLAWKRLWTDKWFGRLFGGGILLTLCGYAVNIVISGILGRLGVQDWQDYYLARAQNIKDLTTPVPNLTGDYIFTATSATVFQSFIGYIMTAIATYGAAVILLRCLKNEEKGWLGAAFGGFKDPFGMLWLFVRGMLIYFGWMLLALLPIGVIAGVCVPAVKPMLETSPFQGAILLSCAFALAFAAFLAIYCIPFYRYRFLFLVKAEHPDWSAGECIRSCRSLMEGHKMESFKLDCSYWKPIALVVLLMLLIAAVIPLVALFKDSGPVLTLLALVAFFAFSACFAGAIVLGQYIGVGQGFFYQDLCQQADQNERN